MKKGIPLKIAVLPGDGIGSEVTKAALPVLDCFQLPIKLRFGDIGWTCWRQEGSPLPERTWNLIHDSDAALIGAITSKPPREALKELAESFRHSPPEYISPIIQLRQRLDLYANVRPCFNISKEDKIFNFCIIRENTEGLYAGFDFYPLPEAIHSLLGMDKGWGKISEDEISCTLRLQSKQGLLRIFRYAFQYAEQRKMTRVTFADKPNVLRNSSAFARNLFEEAAAQYPQIQADILNVDAVALWLIKRPESFGVIVAENMFGDILSDVGAAVMGGLGFAPSANIGKKGCYFEPVHGSGPRVEPGYANPSAMFLTIGMMLEQFGYGVEADKIKQSVIAVVNEGRHITRDIHGSSSTEEMAQAIIHYCSNL
ncbi:DlpA protein [Legionella londiniensis]|uniref:DlpA protein (Isocitrate and isopropylmalate dehydrogenase family protein) n=1 Tax=Legionella londiniensis TaxID=45068 RepID=A0A0W0VQE4_9GAMM|nr:isocitrate/isopropylmalate family dehydrogenase [Legionella londiniensis]KTD21974.1 DlpA protein (isocitrate and isopropylmalate dehydrogenase family protein) [Legionella londiniensis]STX94016.1 DlpA protein [Legionella londiniensis]